MNLRHALHHLSHGTRLVYSAVTQFEAQVFLRVISILVVAHPMSMHGVVNRARVQREKDWT